MEARMPLIRTSSSKLQNKNQSLNRRHSEKIKNENIIANPTQIQSNESTTVTVSGGIKSKIAPFEKIFKKSNDSNLNQINHSVTNKAFDFVLNDQSNKQQMEISECVSRNPNQQHQQQRFISNNTNKTAHSIGTAQKNECEELDIDVFDLDNLNILNNITITSNNFIKLDNIDDDNSSNLTNQTLSLTNNNNNNNTNTTTTTNNKLIIGADSNQSELSFKNNKVIKLYPSSTQASSSTTTTSTSNANRQPETMTKLIDSKKPSDAVPASPSASNAAASQQQAQQAKPPPPPPHHHHHHHIHRHKHAHKTYKRHHINDDYGLYESVDDPDSISIPAALGPYFPSIDETHHQTDPDAPRSLSIIIPAD